MKRPYSLLLHVAYLAACLALILSLELWYSISFEGEWPPTLTDTAIFQASGAIAVIMIIIGPEDMRSQRQWRRFVWVMPLTCIALGVMGYALTWWLYGNELTPTTEIVAWSVLATCTLIGLLIAWYRDKSYEWSEAKKH